MRTRLVHLVRAAERLVDERVERHRAMLAHARGAARAGGEGDRGEGEEGA